MQNSIQLILDAEEQAKRTLQDANDKTSKEKEVAKLSLAEKLLQLEEEFKKNQELGSDELKSEASKLYKQLIEEYNAKALQIDKISIDSEVENLANLFYKQ